MIETFIFDLSEVFISGLVGIEWELSRIFRKNPQDILKSFTGEHLDLLCCGLISEDDYLNQIKTVNEWNVSISKLKKIIRKNFHEKNKEMESFAKIVKLNYNIVLYSDNAIEWMDYILSIHRFLDIFDKHIFSYNIGGRKNCPLSFLKLLDSIGVPASTCLFIDDSNENVKAARSTGIMSFKFTTRENLLCDLANINIIL